MAVGKNSFIIYVDWKQDFEFLTDEEAGKLIKHLLRFASDENPTIENEDRLLQFAAQKMKSVMKKDLKKYEAVIENKRETGKLGGIKSGLSRAKKRKEANEALALKIKQNELVNVNGNVIESKEEEKNNSHVILKSNLFREPTIPTKQNVLECFMRNGGTKEMASKFWNKNNDLGWFINGSPIIKVDGLIANYVQSWKTNEKNKPEFKQERKSAPPLKEA